MNKQEIIKEYNMFLKKYNLMPCDFILGAGGACLMHGIRTETGDMDMDVSSYFFNTLLSTNKYKTHYFGNVLVLEYSSKIDLHANTKHHETIIIEGVCCYSANELLAQKLRLNRPKDQADIIALKEIIYKTKGKDHG